MPGPPPNSTRHCATFQDSVEQLRKIHCLPDEGVEGPSAEGAGDFSDPDVTPSAPPLPKDPTADKEVVAREVEKFKAVVEKVKHEGNEVSPPIRLQIFCIST